MDLVIRFDRGHDNRENNPAYIRYHNGTFTSFDLNNGCVIVCNDRDIVGIFPLENVLGAFLIEADEAIC